MQADVEGDDARGNYSRDAVMGQFFYVVAHEWGTRCSTYYMYLLR